jgi:hypothetical protein
VHQLVNKKLWQSRCDFMFMDSGRHSDVLRNQLRPAVRTEHRGLSSSGACLKRNNVRTQTVKHIQNLKLEVSSYPPCSADLAPQRFSPILSPYKTSYVDVTADWTTRWKSRRMTGWHSNQEFFCQGICVLSGRLEEMCRRWWGLHWRLMSLHSVFAVNNFIYSFRFSFEWPLYIDIRTHP